MIIVDVYLSGELVQPIRTYTWRGRTETEAMTAYQSQLDTDVTLREYTQGRHDGLIYTAKMSVYQKSSSDVDQST
jgi:hypothetical protein